MVFRKKTESVFRKNSLKVFISRIAVLHLYKVTPELKGRPLTHTHSTGGGVGCVMPYSRVTV